MDVAESSQAKLLRSIELLGTEVAPLCVRKLKNHYEHKHHQETRRQSALVTGGSRGIGAAIAKRLAADDAAVALTYSSSPAKADEVVCSIEAAGGKALAVKADAADTEAVRVAVAKTVGAFGELIFCEQRGCYRSRAD